MNNKLPLEILDELLRLRSLLHIINQQTFSYATLNKNYPIDTITEQDAEKILRAYKEISNQIKQQLDNHYKPVES